MVDHIQNYVVYIKQKFGFFFALITVFVKLTRVWELFQRK